MEKTQRIITIDLFKGLAILSTIAIHAALLIGTLDLPLHSKISIFCQLGCLINVPLFFFLSGSTSTIELTSFKKTLVRILKLYIPYSVALLFFLLIISLVSEPLPPNIYKYFLLQVQFMPPHFYFVISSMWFYPNFFLVCLTTPFLLKISKNKNLSLLFLLLLLVINTIFSFSKGWEQIRIYSLVNWHFFLCYLFFYFLGIYLKDLIITRKEFCYMALSLFSLFIYTLKLFDFSSLHLLSFPPKIPVVLGSLLPVLLCCYLRNFEIKFNELLPKSLIIKFFIYNGKNVLTLYLYQGFICSLFLESIIKLPKITNPYFLFLTSFVFILIGTYPLVFLFNKINNRVIRFCFKLGNSFVKPKKPILEPIV